MDEWKINNIHTVSSTHNHILTKNIFAGDRTAEDIFIKEE